MYTHHLRILLSFIVGREEGGAFGGSGGGRFGK